MSPEARFLLIILAFCAFFSQPLLAQEPTAAAPLTFMTEHRPPNNFLDPETGAVTGENTKALRQALAKAGLSATFEIAQWSRSYGLAATTPNTCVYSTVRNSKREPLFKWVGPLDETVFVMVARQDSEIKIATLEDARPFRIGVFAQDVREQMLQFEGGFDLDVVPKDLYNARKLLEGRIDLWFTDLDALAELRADRRNAMKIVMRMPPQRLFLACNLTVADSVIDALNNALRDQREGR